MGINTSGGMLMGAPCDEIELPEEFDCYYEMAEELEMEIFSEWYDADVDGQWIGFSIENVMSENINQEWLNLLQTKAKEFENITGKQPELIGMQNVN